MVEHKKHKTNISNRVLYTLIAIGILAIVGIGVYAFGGTQPSVVGHSAGELDLSGGVNGNAVFNKNVSILGQIKITGGSPGVNKVLTSDTTGLATWKTPSLTCTTRSAPFGGGGGNVYCQTGETRTGGGIEAYHEGDDDWTFSYPVGTNGWQCSAEGAKSGSTCYVVCCKLS